MENAKLSIKTILFYILHFTFYIFLVGCSVKTYSVYAVIKTPRIKVADQGFLKKSAGYKELVIYKDANLPISISVKNSYVCIGSKCMDKEKFVKEFLPKGYPEDFLDKILDRKCPAGFYCKSDDKKILFKDKKNGILIMIKELE